MKQKEARAKEQGSELDQKKKVLDKVKKEEQWAEDDQWRQERLNHRKQLQSRDEPQVRSAWEAKEVDRWCQQRLRDLLVALTVQREEDVPPNLAKLLETPPENPCLRALVTDVLKLEGDASDHEQKAPKSVAKNMIIGGTVKIREFSSEDGGPNEKKKIMPIRHDQELPEDGSWPLICKVKRRHEALTAAGATELKAWSEELREKLFQAPVE
eukprot:g10569.t1